MTPDGAPVIGAEVGTGGGLGTDEGKFRRTANGVTDAKGQFTAIIASANGEVRAFANARGYYENDGKTLHLSKGHDGVSSAENIGRWEPWEQTIQIVLKPIKNPVPMYAKKLSSTFPVLGKPIGYDLEKGDWVAPHGKGAHIDFEFFMESKVESRENYQGSLTLRLPGDGNGIQAYDYD